MLNRPTRETREPSRPRAILAAALLLAAFPSILVAQSGEGPPYPRLANVYLRAEVRESDVEMFSGWDLLVMNWTIDRRADFRDRIGRIESMNPDMTIIAYHLAIGTNGTEQPADTLYTMSQAYDWWLYDYQGNPLRGDWEFNRLVNFTNTEAAKGTHPEGLRPNEFFPAYLIGEHIGKYDFWDGIFYDVFSDNLRWMHRDVKDATRNNVAEYDAEHNEQEPLFDGIWSAGMLTLAENTVNLDPDIVLVGNGLHRTATRWLNGIMFENYKPYTHGLNDLASMQKYIADTQRQRPVSIVNGMVRDHDLRDYVSMRFAMASALMTDAYFSCDFGSQDHAETLWFDEYSVRPGGEVDAVVTRLSGDVDAVQDRLPVLSTAGMPDEGVVWIEGEQVYYGSKSDTELLECVRGYPHVTEKYDLRAPHADGAEVIRYFNHHTGYLGRPVSEAYDVADPSVRLIDLFAAAGWYATDGEADDINSRVWRRDFEKGIVLLNPSGEMRTVTGLGEKTHQKIHGLQDPDHNDGRAVVDSLTLGPEDGIILVRITDQRPPAPPQGLTIVE
jgi:hypothetical protein